MSSSFYNLNNGGTPPTPSDSVSANPDQQAGASFFQVENPTPAALETAQDMLDAAEASAAAAAASELAAAQSETNAAASASAADASADAAAVSEANAASSASTATTKASEADASADAAAASAIAADASADAAAASESNALSYKNAAQSAATDADAKLDQFTNIYYGPSSTAPTSRPDSSARVAGDLYYDSVGLTMKVWNGSSWVIVAADTSAFLAKGNNLSDLQSASTARSNLGLAAVAASGSASDLTTGTLDNARLASGAAVANLGYTPADKAGDTFTGDVEINRNAPRFFLRDAAGAAGSKYASFEAWNAGTKVGCYIYDDAKGSYGTIWEARRTGVTVDWVYVPAPLIADYIHLGVTTSDPVGASGYGLREQSGAIQVKDYGGSWQRILRGSVSTSEIDDGAVTSAKLASGAAVANIANGSLDPDKLTDSWFNGWGGFSSIGWSAMVLTSTDAAANKKNYGVIVDDDWMAFCQINDAWDTYTHAFEIGWSGGSASYVKGNAPFLAAGGYYNFSTTAGSSGYGLRDNSGVVEVKNSGGAWTPIRGIQASTPVNASSTAVDFTGISSAAQRITIAFTDISTNGTSELVFRVGTGGSVATSGYNSDEMNIASGVAATATTYLGLLAGAAAASASAYSGHIILYKVTGNTWLMKSMVTTTTGTTATYHGTSVITLGGALDIVRLTTAGGTNTFDAGTVQLFWE